MQNELNAGDRHAVAQRFIPCAVGCIRDIRPAIGEALEPFALQRRQAADELPLIGIRLADEIGGVLVLARAFRAGDVLLHELIHALPVEDSVMV